MTVVVNDANILIDLIKLELVGHFFRLDWEFHCTDLIIENELYDTQKAILIPYIDSGKLQVQAVSGDDLMKIISTQSESPQLSDKDCSALLYAQKLNAALITSDNALRKYAKTMHVEVHGHLWVFDALIDQGHITPGLAIDKLNELGTVNPKLQLPKRACEEIIERWGRVK